MNMLHEHLRVRLLTENREIEIIYPLGFLKIQKCGKCERKLLSAFQEGQLCMDCEDKENENK